MPQYEEGSVEKLKTKKLFLTKPATEKPKLYIKFKNRPARSVRRIDMRVFALLDLKQRLFLSYLPIIWFVRLVGDLNISIGEPNLSAQFHSLTAKKLGFLVGFSQFFLVF